MPDIAFVCGLGNPGNKYVDTRHNLGFAVLDLIASKRRLRWNQRIGASLETEADFGGRRIVLIKPQTYMNLSGNALDQYRGLTASSLIVICDDINLPLGRLRFRSSGGSGGHKGLESIADTLGTTDFARLRIGAGPAPAGEQWSDFVLDRFSDEEAPAADDAVHRAAEALEMAIRRGMEAAQQHYNAGPPQTEQA